MGKKWYEQSGKQGDVIVSTRVRLARNLKEYPFPCRLDSTQREEVAKKIQEALLHSNSAIADSFQVINMQQMSEEEAVSLWNAISSVRNLLPTGRDATCS